MSDTAEAQPILTAAEHAAADGDYVSAERLLREAASLQERTLGPAHPDLANTLNNLGVVCERAGKDDDAEQCYRRAYSIATTAFAPDHPFVATSRKNLEEFCDARGRLVDFEAEPPNHSEAPLHASAASAPVEAVAPDAGSTEQDPAYIVPASVRVPEERPSRVLPLGAVIVVVIAIAIVVVGWLAWPSSSTRNEVQSDARQTAPTPVAPPVQPSEPTKSASPPQPTTPAPTKPAPPAAKTKPVASSITIADARLCTSLATSGDWRCDQLRGAIGSGTVFFFTRVISPRTTTIQHRWYLGDRLQQNVTLDIAPNSAGYRTYSRRTMSAALAGQWRVELRTEDGQVLREERFTVR